MDHLESQAIKETKWVTLVVVSLKVFFFFFVKAVVCVKKKKKKLFQSLNGGSDTDVRRGSTEADFFIFCRAAEVSKAHRVQLAKRERM